jgi:hypothetical protein
MKGFGIAFAGLLCAALLIATAPAVLACGGSGGNGFTIAQTGGGCGGGACGAAAPANFGSGGSINPAPVPEFAESTWSGSRTMSSLVPASQVRKAPYQATAYRLPQASPSKSAVTTTTNGRDTLQMRSNAKASEVPFVSSDSLTTTTDGQNTRQMKSTRTASTVPHEANADRSPAPPEVPKPTSIRLTFKK